MSDEDRGLLEAEGFGAKVRARGYRIMDVVCFGSLLLAGWSSFMLFHHTADAKDDGKGTVAAFKETAQTIKESQRELVETLKAMQSANAETSRAIAVEQRKQTEAIREANCLLALPPDRRIGSAEFCKRVTRDR